MSSSTPTDVCKSWRDVLKIHPAADLFPLMSAAELKELAEDIKNHGLRTSIIIWSPDLNDEKNETLLDGRNRLDALELLGLLGVDNDGVLCLNKQWNGHEWDRHGVHWLSASHTDVSDPYAIALSYNVHRRHLTTEQKRELIAKVLKATPEKSNNRIAKEVKVDDKTIEKVRRVLESRSEIPKLAKTVGKDGKSRPASKPKRPSKSKQPPHKDIGAALSSAMDSFLTCASGNDVDTEASAEQRRAVNAELESADDGDRKSATEPDKKPKPTNRFANVANARKRRAALEPLIIWMSGLPEWELRQVFEAIGVRRVLAGIPESWLPAVAQWIAERPSPARSPQAEPRPDQDNLSIPASLQRAST